MKRLAVAVLATAMTVGMACDAALVAQHPGNPFYIVGLAGLSASIVTFVIRGMMNS